MTRPEVLRSTVWRIAIVATAVAPWIKPRCPARSRHTWSRCDRNRHLQWYGTRTPCDLPNFLEMMMLLLLFFFWMCISIYICIWICLEPMKWTWTWILEPLLQALWIGIIQMDPLQSWLVKMSSSSCFWLIKRDDLIVYFQSFFFHLPWTFCTFLVRFMVRMILIPVVSLRADKPENPRRLNSCPQKRGTKSSTDLASRIVEKPSDFLGKTIPIFVGCQYEGYFSTCFSTVYYIIDIDTKHFCMCCYPSW